MCKKTSALIITAALVLTGCSGTGVYKVSPDADSTFVSMENEAVISYDVPMSRPHILTDQLGYEPGSRKLSFMYGKDLPEEFELVDASTLKTVFTGKVESKGYYDDYSSEIGVADFSEYDTPGTYYIESKHLGRSYTFDIGSNLYDDIFREACRTYYYNRCGITLTEDQAGVNAHNACHTQNAVLRQDMTVQRDVTGGWHQDSTGSKDIVSSSKVMGCLLLSYELFPDAFTDDTGIPESGNGIPDILDEARYETEWFLKMQDDETGAVFSGITVTPGSNGPGMMIYVEKPDMESARAFAFAVAKFGYFYQTYDIEFATMCLKAADRAFKYSLLNEEAGEGNTPFKLAAACEIYRASGSEQCQTYIDSYFGSSPVLDDPDEITVQGLVTYINTKVSVNRDYCTTAINAILKEAEEISEKSRNSALLVPEGPIAADCTELLSDMLVMTVVDHIITNNEYDNVLVNSLHYILGRNGMSVSYIDNVGEFSYRQLHDSLGIMKQFGTNSELIFMLSRMMSRDGFVEE
ncbi:MAG: glycoside hydrolase family 9 protein [Lachnospiraceae bacterium]|nr:glycoside hydrolase family 9 protein [Lachnospiraceae bacterium]